ncbi:MAG: FmdB family zinc ribbon protein [Aquihabitans sp.]
MPTYEYRCKDCSHQFDIVQSFSDDSLTECPECKGTLKKVFGNVGISFKGGGFYKTDSRPEGSSKASSDSDRSNSKSDNSKSDSSKSDSSTKESSTSSSSDSSSSSSSGSTAAASAAH